MLDKIEIIIPGRPVPWARAGLKGKQHYTPPKQRGHMEDIKVSAYLAMDGRPPLEGAISAVIWFYYRAPKSRNIDLSYPAQWPHTIKPDVDNLYKLVADALTGIAYKDDAQISYLQLNKNWGPDYRTVVHLYEMGGT